MSGHESLVGRFLDGTLELANAGRPDPLRAVIAGRVQGKTEPLEGLVSPPLGRDEPDRNAILYLVYHTARRQECKEAVVNLRRTAAELLMQGLNENSEHQELEAFARLVGHYRVVDTPATRDLLQQQLYGFLATALEQPFTDLARLDGKSLRRATCALDVWLAVTPVRPQWPHHHEEQVENLFTETVEILRKRTLPLEPRFDLLALSFRALARVKPNAAGRRGLWGVCDLIHRLGTEQPALRRRWLGVCYRQGLALAAYKGWRKDFLAGVKNFRREGDFERFREVTLFEEALKRLDGMWSEVDDAWKLRSSPLSNVVPFQKRDAA